jgi:PPOX class probable F420-dependent enzyme
MNRLAQFAHQRYLNLETYRRNGEAVRTPLWFVEHAGVLYMRTPGAAAKVRRIRRNPRVRVAPCGRRAELRGVWVEGRATLMEAAQADWVNQLARRKYGLLKRLVDLRTRLQRIEYVVIAVQV